MGIYGLLLAPLLTGCGSGKNLGITPGSTGSPGSSRQMALTKFDVDVASGKVTVTPVASQGKAAKGRAVLTGSAVSFTSSDLLAVGGDSGQRKLTLNVTNNSGQILPQAFRLVVGNLSNATANDVKANTITSTFAGSGTSGSADGAGTAAQFSSPATIVGGAGPNRGSFFVGENYVIRKITPDGMVTTFAGASGTSGYSDGFGTAARFNVIRQLACDASGNLFVSDYGNHTVRRITPQGVVTTIGDRVNGGGTTLTDGSGASATFGNPSGIAVTPDGTHIYVSDVTWHNIRRINLLSGGDPAVASSYGVETIAGPNAQSGGLWQAGTTDAPSGPASGASFNTPISLSVTVDSTGTETVYSADRGSGLIRRISPAGAYPYGALTASVVTIAGNGTGSMTDGNATSAVLNSIWGINAQIDSIDTSSSTANQSVPAIYFVDANAVRVLTLAPGADPRNKASYSVSTVAGSASTGSQDGTGNGSFNTPEGVWVLPASGTSATVVVTDANNVKVRKLNVASIPHSGGAGSSVTELVRLMNADSEVPNQTGSAAAWVRNVSGTTDTLQFYVPKGVSGFSFTAYIETDTDVVNLPAVGSASVSTLAGDGVAGYFNGAGKLSEFNTPSGIAVVPSSLQSAFGVSVRALIADGGNNKIRGIDAAGNTFVLAGSTSGNADGTGPGAQMKTPTGIAIAPDGNAFITDPASGNYNVRRVSPAGSVTTVAGTGSAGYNDGAGNVATFTSPQGITIDSGGTIYVADGTKIRKIQQVGADPTLSSSYKVTTVTIPSFTPNTLSGIAVDTDGRLYVTDKGNHIVVTLTRTGVDTMSASTLAGTSGTSGTTDATGTSAKFNQPSAISVDSAHNLYVADTGSNLIRRISPGGAVVTLAGSTSGFTEGLSGKFNGPRDVAVEPSGNLLVIDQTNHAVRAVQRVVTDGQLATQ